MRILYIDINYLFNKFLNYTIKQQRIKYSHKQMPKNIIILNKYNLIIDTVLSIVSLIDKYISSISNKYDKMYIFNTDMDVAKNLPSKYNTGYYIPAYKRFGAVNDLIDSNMYTTKLINECLTKIPKGSNIDAEESSIRKHKMSKKKMFKLKIANNVYNVIDEYTKYYIKNYEYKWNNYDPTKSANKTSKLSHYIKDFKLNVFLTQNYLTTDEIYTIFSYIVSCSKIEKTNITEFKLSNDIIDIFSDKLFTDKSIHDIDNMISPTHINYYFISDKDNNIHNSNMLYKLRHQTITKINNFNKNNKTLLDILMNTKKNVWKNNIIDIDEDNNINLFTEHTKEDLYYKAHTDTILTSYNFMNNYRTINYVDDRLYIKYVDKMLKHYNFDNFILV